MGKKALDVNESTGGTSNVSVHFKIHGFPARPTALNRKDTVTYIVNELDDLKVDSTVIFIFGKTLHDISISDVRNENERYKGGCSETAQKKSSNTGGIQRCKHKKLQEDPLPVT